MGQTPGRRSATAAALLLCACVAGCASAPDESRRILGDLAAAGLSVPDEDGRASTPVAEQPRGPLNLAELRRLAEANSPRLAAAKSAMGVAAGSAWQASLYPNPAMATTLEDVSAERGVDTATVLVGVTQPVVLGGRLTDAQAAGRAEEAVAAADVEVTRRELLAEVELRYTEAVAAGEALALSKELRGLVERTLAIATGRFEAGVAPESDVVRPRIEMARLRREASRLEGQRRAAASRLAALTGVAIDGAAIEGGLPVDAADAGEGALAEALRRWHPALVRAQAEVSLAEARLRQVRSEVTPDLELSVAGGYDEELGDAVVQLGAGVTVPIWDRRQGDILAGRFAVLAARQRAAAVEADLLGALAAAVEENRSASEQLRVSREEVIPAAEHAAVLAEGAYRAGRGSFIDALDAQRTLVEARMLALEEAREVALAAVRVRWLSAGPVSSGGPAPGPAVNPRGDPQMEKENP